MCRDAGNPPFDIFVVIARPPKSPKPRSGVRCPNAPYHTDLVKRTSSDCFYLAVTYLLCLGLISFRCRRTYAFRTHSSESSNDSSCPVRSTRSETLAGIARCSFHLCPAALSPVGLPPSHRRGKGGGGEQHSVSPESNFHPKNVLISR